MKRAYSVGQAVADRVREVDRRRAGSTAARQTVGDEAGSRAGGVLARELDLVARWRRALGDRRGRMRDDLGGLEPKLLSMWRAAGREEDVDP